MDERLVLYFNDVDLSARLAAAGWKTRYLHGAVVVHALGASTRLLPERLERWHLDRLRYYAVRHGRAAALWVKCCTCFAWLDFVLGNLRRRARVARGGPGAQAEPLGPTTRAFARFLRSRAFP